jgi:hypothetical protein
MSSIVWTSERGWHETDKRYRLTNAGGRIKWVEVPPPARIRYRSGESGDVPVTFHLMETGPHDLCPWCDRAIAATDTAPWRYVGGAGGAFGESSVCVGCLLRECGPVAERRWPAGWGVAL